MKVKTIRYVNILDLVEEACRDGVADFIDMIEDSFWGDDDEYSYILSDRDTMLERLNDNNDRFDKSDLPEGWEQLKTTVKNLDPDIQIEISRRFS